MLYDGEYRVYMVNFHNGTIKGAMTEDADGFATIYINDQMPPQEQQKAFLHELKHAEKNDLYNDRPISEVEQCHGRKSST